MRENVTIKGDYTMESEQHLLNLTTLELIRIIQDQKDSVERYEKALKEIDGFEGMTLYEAQSIAQEALIRT
jgi:translation elongation factor EF-1beta